MNNRKSYNGDLHEKAKQKISLEKYEEKDEIAERLQMLKRQLTEGKSALQRYEEISGAV